MSVGNVVSKFNLNKIKSIVSVNKCEVNVNYRIY